MIREYVRKEFVAKVEAQIEASLNTFDAQAIAKEIIRDIRKEKQDFTLNVLGVETKWDEWTVESSSPLAAAIANEVETTVVPVVRQIVAEELKRLLPSLRTTTARVIRKCVNSQMEYSVEREARQAVTDALSTIIEETKQDILSGGSPC